MAVEPSEAELEAVMRQELFLEEPPNSNPPILSENDNNLNDNKPALDNLEELMRKSFFPQVQPRSLTRYQYQPFETEDSIRLFELQPGSHKDLIKGRLLFVPFDSKPRYEALSYTWGPPAMHHNILSDDGFIPMTASVRSALTRLRLQNRVRLLWIDALCINQQDNDEKSKQILLMPKIYSSAWRTLVHLGPYSDRSDLALKLLEKIAKTSFHGLPGKFVSESDLATFGLPRGRAQVWKYLRSFWARRWFQRIWVMQEFVLAKDITMICGDWEGSWEIFLEATVKISDYRLLHLCSDLRVMEQLEADKGLMLMVQLCIQRVLTDKNKYLVYRLTLLLEMGESMTREVKPGETILAAMVMRVRLNPNLPREFSRLRQNDDFDRYAYFGLSRSNNQDDESLGTPLIEVIGWLEAAEATDGRDRLFALLSLASDLDEKELTLLRPDYEEEARDVVCRYASVLIQKGNCMKILYQSFFQPDSNNLPSWVGDWITPVSSISKKAHIAEREPAIYRAAGNSQPKARMGPGLKSDVLIISGGLVDTIDCLGTGPIISRTGGPLLPMLANAALDNADAIFSTLSSYPTGEPLSEVKWRTLIANKTAITRQEPPEWYGDLFLRWREEIRGKTFAPTNNDIYNMAPEEYFHTLCSVSNQKLCRTKGGYVGLVPTPAEVGDHVCVLLGGIVPFVIRESDEREGMFRMIGGCYIHGMMKGEAFGFPHWRERSFELH